MSLRHLIKWAGLSVVLFGATPLLAAEKPSFADYVGGLKKEAIEKGYSAQWVDQVFSQVSYRKRIVKADKNQAEFKLTLERYLNTRVPEWKVKQAREKFKKHEKLLQEIGKKFGVQPRFIVALWGLETNFGRIQGKHKVVDSLVTLAYDGRREALFKRELWAALKILDQDHISQDKFIGSWAGAMGQTQFMPSSFLAYAVDYDGDGKKDIWGNQKDAFASIANYLKSEGWNDAMTWGRQVKLPTDLNDTLVMTKERSNKKLWNQRWNETKRSLKDWNDLGLRRMDGNQLPTVDIKATLIVPDDRKGRAYLAYDNFKTLMHWNRSYYFVASVGLLSDRIKYPAMK
ncbi:lytic murein transglycosylase [Algicola sagamiensis]|uniref:lytic murein transglycosylase n=1 Tax=Algicola sagamiensis TaxID=163869 RepID=UPI00037D27B4|nr:lytic murein transglycosylase [Algicola sagamiensis]